MTYLPWSLCTFLSYSDVVPLGIFLCDHWVLVSKQDTTAEMGATAVCPGTHNCANVDATTTCEGHGFQVADDEHVWETGTGMLMNQQSFHRGAAHVEPQGPDRVVFIVTFAPKRMERGEIRMLGQGGSYSTRWDMWGHTLRDLEHARNNVRWPWSILRALGVYKPKNAEWGWDFISQMSMRCANFGIGFEGVEQFLNTITIPKMFLVDYEKGMSYSEYLRACIKKWKTWAFFINKVAVVSYVAFFSAIGVVALVFSRSFSKRVFEVVFWTTIRVAVLYVSVAFLSYYMYQRGVMDSRWAQEIRRGTFMQPPFIVVEKIESLLKREPIAINNSSILITDRFNFKFLNSIADVPKYHPGNMILASEIRAARKTFNILNLEDKKVLANTIVDNAFERGSNFVVHNDDAIWVPLTLNEAKSYVAKELHLQNSPLLTSLEREASFLLSFYRYGSSAMARKLSVMYINTIMDRIYAKARFPTFNIYQSTKKIDAKKSSRLFLEKCKPKAVSVFNLVRTNLSEIQHQQTKKIGKVSSVPRTQTHNKTSSTAQTLSVGDIVEGQYEGLYDEVRIL